MIPASVGSAVLLACSVCGAVSPAARTAYAGTTVFLSLLPLVFIGLVVLYVRSEILAQASVVRPLRDEAVRSENERGARTQHGARGHATREAPLAEEEGGNQRSGERGADDESYQTAVAAKPVHS